MRTNMVDVSSRKASIIAGTAIRVMTISAVLATDVAIGSLVIPSDAAATTVDIAGSRTLSRSGILIWLIILILIGAVPAGMASHSCSSIRSGLGICRHASGQTRWHG
jgi:hypothetical protein